MTRARREQIIEALRASKEYRDAFVRAEIRRGVPFQLRATRQRRGWTQKQLADRTGQKQGTISQLENPNYGRLTLSSLLKLASALDVGLLVTLVPFSELANWAADLPVHVSADSLEIPAFGEDLGLNIAAPPVDLDSLEEASFAQVPVEESVTAAPPFDLRPDNVTDISSYLPMRQTPSLVEYAEVGT